MATIPKDPAMLLSYMNMQLRDHYDSLEECCQSLCADQKTIEAGLAEIDYYYDREKNQFV